MVTLICLLPLLPTQQQPALLPFENAVCRVSIQCADGSTSHGSGVLIQSPPRYASNGHSYVATCWHILQGRRQTGSISVTWDGVTLVGAVVAATRPGCDAAILKLTGQVFPVSTPRVPIAAQPISQGEAVYVMGFGDAISNTLRTVSGRMVQHTSNRYGDPVWCDVTGTTRQGDSGGPAFVIRQGQVRVVGNAWGCDRSTITVTRLVVLQRLFGMTTAPTNRGNRGSANQVIYASSGSS